MFGLNLGHTKEQRDNKHYHHMSQEDIDELLLHKDSVITFTGQLNKSEGVIAITNPTLEKLVAY